MITEMQKINNILESTANTTLTLTDIISIEIKEWENSEDRKQMLIGEKYYENDTDIKNKLRTYIDENGLERVAPHLPNNKLQHGLARKLVDQKTGYLLSLPLTVKSNNEADKEHIDLVKQYFNKKRQKILKNTQEEATNKGIAWWLIYIDEIGKLKFKLMTSEEIVPLWKDREHENLDGVIRCYEIICYEGKNKKTVKKVEFYNLDGVRYYVFDGDKLIPDIQQIELKSEYLIRDDNEIICCHFLLGEGKYNWNRVPFVYWKYNKSEKPLISYLKSLIDCYDKLTSANADTIEETPDGVNVVKNYSEEANTFTKNLNTYKTVFVANDGDYRRESVTMDSSNFQQFIQLLRKDIYEAGRGVDTQSDKFGNNPSRRSIKTIVC